MGTLVKRLAPIVANEMCDLVEQIMRTGLPRSSQQKTGAPLSSQPCRQVGDIDWHLPSIQIDRRIRALNPYNYANTYLSHSKVIILSGVSTEMTTNASAGEIIAVDNEGVYVATGAGVYCIRALYFGLEWVGGMPQGRLAISY